MSNYEVRTYSDGIHSIATRVEEQNAVYEIGNVSEPKEKPSFQPYERLPSAQREKKC